MARHNINLGTLTIASGQTASGALSASHSVTVLKAVIGHAIDFVVFTPDTLTGTVTAEVAVEPGGTDWKTVQSNGSDVSFGADKAVIIPIAAFGDLRMVSGSAEGADRIFTINAQVDMG